MRQSLKVLGVAVALMTSSVAVAKAGELQMRSFDRFIFDSATAHGLWAELAIGSAHKDDQFSGGDLDLITVAPVIAYGNENWEGGFVVPYRHIEASACNFFGCADASEDGIGDVQLYGKYVYRSEYIHIGAGVDFSLPSGDEDVGLGAGELGIVPFGTAAIVLGPVQLRTHIGNVFYTDSRNTAYGDYPPDELLWGAGAFWTINDIVGVRAEAVGSRISDALYENAVSFEPGVDIRIPAGRVDVMLRPTGAVGLTDRAADWGIGGAVAVLFEP